MSQVRHACQVYIGKLVSHPCGRKTKETCPQCKRIVCPRHRAAEGDSRCVECAGLYVPPAAPVRVAEGELLAFSAEEMATFDDPFAKPTRISQVDDS